MEQLTYEIEFYTNMISIYLCHEQPDTHTLLFYINKLSKLINQLKGR